MTFGLVYDKRMMLHEARDRPSHPESPRRIEAIWDRLVEEGITTDSRVTLLESREVLQEELLRCHNARYLQKVQRQMQGSEAGTGLQGGDMFASYGTYTAAALAAGSSIALVDAIADEDSPVTAGFAIVRPPGHHAKCGAYGGFCYYNNVMLAATHLTDLGKKVYIVDWDVHIGDGSINIMKSALQRDNDLIRYFSIHRWDRGSFYPGGAVGQSGFDASGRALKVGFNGSQGDEFYLQTWIETLMPSLRDFAPDVIIVSAGFDAAVGDPLGDCDVTPHGYTAMLDLMIGVTPNIALILEGGYNLQSISSAALACVRTFLPNDNTDNNTNADTDGRKMLDPNSGVKGIHGLKGIHGTKG